MAIATSQFRSSFTALPVTGKALLLVLLLMLISAAYYVSVHMNLTSEINAAAATHQRLQVSLQEARARQQEYLKLRAELAEREPSDRQNLRILPEEAEIPAFLGDLNRLAELSGLTMLRVQPRPEEVEEFYVKIPVSLAVTGRYHQIGKFFYNVSRLERAVNMDNVVLQDPKTQGDEVTISVDVLATTFRRRGPGDKYEPKVKK
jgi:type IV pilus assembly protein PilO